jgi:SAM-dependent methyltransferase
VTLPSAYFDGLYEAAPDPWSLESRWYEQRKYAVTVAGLPRARYRRGLELGCSVGVLTSCLAERCESLLAVDVAEAAVAATKRRLHGRAGVEVRQVALPGDWPSGTFDLIVLSEVGYYFSPAVLGELVAKSAGSLDADGALVAVHWRHIVADYPLRGDDVHAAIAKAPGLDRLLRHDEEDFLLEVFVPGPAVSVARATGLLS